MPQLEEALTIAPIVSVQNRYSLELRTTEDTAVLAACAKRGIAFVPYFSIASLGRHAGRSQEDNEAVAAVAAQRGVAAAQIRLAWTLHLGENVLVIPGTGDPGHLRENVAAAGLRLSADEIETLNAGCAP